MRIREIQEKDNNSLFLLIRKSLEDAELNIPGTAYFDESIKAMSEYYKGFPKRKYFVVVDENDEVLGGAGFAEFNNDSVAELQKLYIFEHARGKGLGCKLVKIVEEEAKKVGYKKLYLETHHNLSVAINLYKKLNYKLLKTPLVGSEHSTMDYFFEKELN